MLEIVAHDSDQYSRRNSQLITGISENEDEDTEATVSKLASDIGVHMKQIARTGLEPFMTVTSDLFLSNIYVQSRYILYA